VPIFSVISQLGLILLMFMVGLELDLTHLRTNGRTAIRTSFVGILVPFGLGFLVSQIIYPWVGAGIHRLGFSLIMATALSVTAMPVLARIMMDLNIRRSPIDTITITSAAINDAAGWIILTVVAAIVRSEIRPVHTLLMVFETIRGSNDDGADTPPAGSLYGCDICSQSRVGKKIGRKNAVVKSFRRSPMVSRKESSAERTAPNTPIMEKMPIRFVIAAETNTITINAASVVRDTSEPSRSSVRRTQRLRIGRTIRYIARPNAIPRQTGRMPLAGRIAGRLSWKTSATIGILMNTRGLMELIVINLGYDLGIIPRSVFCMLVLMAVVTTYMTTPLVRCAIRNTELEDLVEQSPFILGSRKHPVIRSAP